MMPTITRDEAFARGASKFFTGRPCKNNHFSQRYVTTGACVSCQREHMRKYKKPIFGLTRLTLDLHPDDFEMVRDFAMAIIEARNRGPNLASAKAARQALVDHAATGAATPPAGRLKDLADKAPVATYVTTSDPRLMAAHGGVPGPGAAFAAIAATGALSPFKDD